MIGQPYWDKRLHRWGAWLATDAGRLSSTPLAKMRALGVRIQMQGEADAPMVHEAERETDSMIKALPRRAGLLIDSYYRTQLTVYELSVELEVHPDTVRRGIRDSQARLQRMLDERRRGHAKIRTKAITILGEAQRGRGRTLASVVPED